MIVLSTVFAGRSNLSRACAEQEEAFFTVTEGKAPVYYVDQIISASASLADLAEKNEASADAAADLRTARRALVSAEEKRDISDMYAAYRSVLSAADSVEFGIDDPTDKALYDSCKTVISGASRELEKSDYNDKVNDFLIHTYYSFPGALFARLFMVDAPELFA